MKKMKDLLKKHKYLWLSLLLTLILIGIIFAFKGIYPFGKEIFNIGNFDYNYVPLHRKLTRNKESNNLLFCFVMIILPIKSATLLSDVYESGN